MLTGWCGDAQNASDILQEVFRRLAESPAVMIRMKKARAFLAVSARRIAVDFARRSNTRSAYQTAAGAETPTAENPGPTDENLRTVITKALDALPVDQRSVFEHKILNGRTLDEIAKLEGVSLNTVASRLRYALDKIRGQLRPYYDDLNRTDFKLMKNDPSNGDQLHNKRIITPLAPKRVPSVAPGLEGLAAMAPDACEVAPESVEAAPAVELVEPEIADCGVGGNAWEQGVPEAVELPAEDGGGAPDGEFVGDDIAVTNELPEMVTCEIFPWDGEIPDEWLRPISVVDLPEDFLVNLFEGEGELVGEEGSPYELESGFEICVLPVPEEFYAGFDPNELLARYEDFLSHDPTWLSGLAEGQGDWFHEQVTTASGYFEKLQFGTPGEANAFDHWFDSNIRAAADGTGEEGADYGNEQPDYTDGSWSFDPKDLLVRYYDFLREKPDWGTLDPNMMEIQVVTPSSYFGELEFGTPSKAAAFDSWYEANYAQSNDDGAADGSGTIIITRPDGSGYGTIISDPSFDGVGGISAEWLRGGTYQSGILYNTSGGIGPVPVTGLALSGGTGSFGGETVLTGGEVAIDPALYQPRYENFLAANPGWVNQHSGNDAAYDRWLDIAYGTGQATPAESEALLRVYTSEFAQSGNNENTVADARSIGRDAELFADLQQLPFEVSQGSDDLVLPGSVEPRLATGGVSPAQMQIVEFSVLSPSEPIQSNSDGLDLRAATGLQSSQLSENGVEAVASDSAGALPDANPSQDLFGHPATPGQEQASTTSSSHKIDAPTATAGAVAAGTVVHSGAAAPAVRRPLFKA